MAKIIFVTGTDTGVGKTVLTGLLLSHLRAEGRNALAMKPFCSGAREDAVLLGRLQENLLTIDDVNPFFFTEPVAPAAAEGGPRNIRLDSVVKKIRRVAERCDVLLVEGIGGVLVPLARNLTVADVMVGLKCPVILVAANRLGTINHTLLSLSYMQSVGVKDITVVLMEVGKKDISGRTNAKMIGKMAPEAKIFSFPRVDFTREKGVITKKCEKNVKKLLHSFCGMIV